MSEINNGEDLARGPQMAHSFDPVLLLTVARGGDQPGAPEHQHAPAAIPTH